METKQAISHWLSLCVELFKKSSLFRGLVIAQVAIIGMLVTGALCFGPQTVQFSFTQTACIGSSVLLPSSQTAKGDAYTVSYDKVIAVFGKPVLARKTCIKPTIPPAERKQSVVTTSLFGSPLFSKKITVKSGAYPTLASDIGKLKVISVADPLELKLTSPDGVFEYALSANNKMTLCVKRDDVMLLCDPRALGLQHATVYNMTLDRVFNKQPVQTVSAGQVETVRPVLIAASSIAQDSIRYDKPKEIQITVNKAVKEVRGVALVSDNGAKIPLTANFKDTKINLVLSKELDRGQKFKLTIDAIIASDGGSLINPYVLSFATSKGPRVTGANISASGVGLSQSIVISFDQEIESSQNVSKELALIVAGQPKGFAATARGNTIILNPNEDFAKCSTFGLKLSANITSPAGITGESAWEYNSRATCFDSFSIGTSVKGRSIVAYRYGTGANAVLYVGGIHGNEQNASRLLEKWMAEVNANPDKVPVNRTIVIIPSANPDGYAVNQRVNARGIDLNRNFPANNWKSSVKEPSGVVLEQGGGPSAGSEPETSALTTYVRALRPLIVMSYHSNASAVIANDAGSSRSLTDAYGAKSGYRSKNGDTVGNLFNYDTTGAFEDWLHDVLAMPAILVELQSSYDDEFGRNKSAMWMIAQNGNF